ncbi:hypothetical protein PV08_10118 [Exophiala spinifera]|uniref:Protein kinase domain-containing protein n=1 Tax=Exophiala spinifera TaxID=91928 RepID=A0A0D2BHH8_9EURO|nr:uncharacterized protein PV08_10118 [Exophiala spinifera]KIW10819.1 hypothetical protein PV08_10118 [Exophiala spinifera]
MDTRDGGNSNESFAGQPRSLDDFTLLKRIGRGNTADALLAETVLDGQHCVVRAVRKKSIFGEDEAARVFAQKEILSRPQVLEHPFIITLQSTFQNKSHLFFVTEFVAGGDLMFHLREGRFELSRTSFYAAEVCLALQFLHSRSILHRGVSLDNILLASNGHIKLVGFSNSKLLTRPRTRSFAGSATFVAPEVLLGHDYGFSVDWWAFGVVLYQMLLHREPFSGDSEDEVLTAILDRVADFPSDLPSHAETLLKGLFERDPDQRFWA